MVRNRKDSMMMPHLTSVRPTHLRVDTELGLTTRKLPEVVNTQSDYCSKVEKPLVARLDLNYVPKEHRERLR